LLDILQEKERVNITKINEKKKDTKKHKRVKRKLKTQKKTTRLKKGLTKKQIDFKRSRHQDKQGTYFFAISSFSLLFSRDVPFPIFTSPCVTVSTSTSTLRTRWLAGLTGKGSHFGLGVERVLPMMIGWFLFGGVQDCC